jgi:hypothetical protein
MKAAEWIILSGVVFYFFTILALFDIVRKDFGGIGKKAVWAFICMVPYLGVLLYLAIGFRKGKRPSAG